MANWQPMETSGLWGTSIRPAIKKALKASQRFLKLLLTALKKCVFYLLLLGGRLAAHRTANQTNVFSLLKVAVCHGGL